MKTPVPRFALSAALMVVAGLAAGCPTGDPISPAGAGGAGAPSGSGGSTPASSGGGGGVSSGSGGMPSGSGGLPGTAGATNLGTGGTTGTGTGGASAGTGGTGATGGSDPQGSGGRSATGGGAGGSSVGGSAAGGRGGGTAQTGGSSGTGGRAGNLKATMVVRGVGTPTPGDMLMSGRLTAFGFQQIVIVSDAAVTAQSVADSDLVVISSSAESGPLQSKLRDVAMPVLCIEDAEFPLMGMASTGGHDADVSQVVIVDGGAPLVGAATGMVTISSRLGELGWGTFPASAAVVRGATMPGNPARAAIFGYPKGAQMATIVAPGRRAGFAIREVLAANLNAEGIKLFDAILAWVMQ